MGLLALVAGAASAPALAGVGPTPPPSTVSPQAAPVSTGAGPAAPASAEAEFLTRINSLRTSRGLAPLVPDTELSVTARSWAARMAGSGDLAHNPSLGSLRDTWRRIGENVGTGSSVASLTDAFVSSPLHFANLVDPTFRSVGVGVVQGPDALWVVHDFGLRADAAGQSTAAPVPAPVAAPVLAAPHAAPSPAPVVASAAPPLPVAPAPPPPPAGVEPPKPVPPVSPVSVVSVPPVSVPPVSVPPVSVPTAPDLVPAALPTLPISPGSSPPGPAAAAAPTASTAGSAQVSVSPMSGHAGMGFTATRISTSRPASPVPLPLVVGLAVAGCGVLFSRRAVPAGSTAGALAALIAAEPNPTGPRWPGRTRAATARAQKSADVVDIGHLLRADPHPAGSGSTSTPPQRAWRWLRTAATAAAVLFIGALVAVSFTPERRTSPSASPGTSPAPSERVVTTTPTTTGAPAPAPAPNLLGNGSFEAPGLAGVADQLIPWGDSQFALVNAPVRVGATAQRVDVAPGRLGGAWFEVPVEPASTYQQVVALNVVGLAPDARVEVILESYDVASALLDYRILPVESPPGEWVTSSQTVTVPGGTARVRFVVNIRGGGAFVMDDARLTPAAPESASPPLANG